MAKKQDTLDELLEMARAGDSESLSDVFRQLLPIYAPLSVVQDAFEVLLRSVTRIRGRSERARAFDALLLLIQALYTTKDIGKAQASFEKALRAWKEIPGDKTQVKWLKAMTDFLAKLLPLARPPLELSVGPPAKRRKWKVKMARPRRVRKAHRVGEGEGAE